MSASFSPTKVKQAYSRKLRQWVTTGLLVGVFLGATGAFMLTGSETDTRKLAAQQAACKALMQRTGYPTHFGKAGCIVFLPPGWEASI